MGLLAEMAARQKHSGSAHSFISFMDVAQSHGICSEHMCNVSGTLVRDLRIAAASCVDAVAAGHGAVVVISSPRRLSNIWDMPVTVPYVRQRSGVYQSRC